MALEEFPNLGNGWKVVLTTHAQTRVKARFRLEGDAAQEFVEDQLLQAGPARKRPGGVVRWTTESTQVVGRYVGSTIEVVTCYPKPKQRSWGKKRKETWRKQGYGLLDN